MGKPLLPVLLLTVHPASADWPDGFELGASAVTVLQGTSGMMSEGDSLDASVSLDLEASQEAGENGMILLLLETGVGEGQDHRTGSVHGLNAAADDDDNIRLSELLYEHSWWDGAAALRTGMVSPCAAGFDGNAVAGSEAGQFLSGGFVNSPVIDFPDNGFGFVLWTSPASALEFAVAVMDAEASWTGFGEALFTMAEVCLKPGIGGREGSYRLYGWMNGADHEVIANPEEGKEGNSGLGISFDQDLSESFSLFCRCGVQDQTVSQMGAAWSAGMQWEGPIGSRPSDILGIACGSAVNGDDHTGANPESEWEDESHGEFYYRIDAGGNITVTPDIQWLRNPGGVSTSDDIIAFGLRMHLSF
jgi:carbohydrate-selective porin OprB